MPRPKRLTQFPLVRFIQLFHAAAQSEVALTFADAKKAFEVRSQLYAFRAALKREGGHPALSVEQADSIIIKVRGSKLILNHRAVDDPDLAAALDAALGKVGQAPAPAPAAQETKPDVMDDASAALLEATRAALGRDPFGLKGDDS